MFIFLFQMALEDKMEYNTIQTTKHLIQTFMSTIADFKLFKLAKRHIVYEFDADIEEFERQFNIIHRLFDKVPSKFVTFEHCHWYMLRFDILILHALNALFS